MPDTRSVGKREEIRDTYRKHMCHVSLDTYLLDRKHLQTEAKFRIGFAHEDLDLNQVPGTF